uniref:INTS8 TPR repeats domain-containing protein n=1 Tax=Meloidogyne floridensis TaxID=298350 RepID=A0A915P0P9_9BILA
MDIQLNFLKFQPLKNWLDYFLNRQELRELLNQTSDFNFVITLCDQFVEQAFVTEKELAQVGKIYLDQEDKICLKYKANDLWLCAMSCFACCNWDLGLLMKNLNVQKIQSLFDQLVKWTLLQEEIVQDPFDYFCSVTSSEKFDTKRIFSVWLYARWILLVDSEARFPSIPAKPTVSNPYNYLDQSLLQAEKLAQTILEVQKKMPQAIKLLDQMWNLYSGIYVPKKECFYPNLEVITEGSNLQDIGEFSKPDIQKYSWFFKVDIFQLRTAFDLFNAHFCAKHFSKATTLFEFITKAWQRLKNNSESIDEENKYFLPSEQDINGFACALGFDIPKENSSLCQSGDINLFMQFSLVRPRHKIPVNILVELLSMGICRVSKIYLDKELRQSEELRLELIKSFQSHLSSLNGLNSKIKFIQRARLLGSLYFLCSHCFGFADTLVIHGKLSEDQKIRNLAQSSTVDMTPTIPSDLQLQEFTKSENALWNVVTSFDINVLRNSFAQLDPSIRIENKRMVFSPVSADPILNAINASGDRFFIRSQIMLWKLEQLALQGNMKKWTEFVNKFSEDCKVIEENKELQMLLLCDSMRIGLTIWNTDFCRPSFPHEFVKNAAELKQQLNGVLTRAIQDNKSTFQIFSKELTCYLLNNREWSFTSQRIKNQPLLTTPFTNIAVIFSFFFTKLYVEKKRDEAFKTAREVIWKVLTPTFDAVKFGQEPRQCMIGKEALISLIEGLKDLEVLNIFIGFVSFLYNFVLTTYQKPLKSSINSTGESDAVDNSTGTTDESTSQQQHTETTLLRAVGRNVYLDNVELWQSISTLETYKTYDIDVDYVEKVLDLLAEQASLVGPVYLPWLCFRADYAFARERYEEATLLYLETIIALDRGLNHQTSSQEVGTTSTTTKQLKKKMDIDLIYSKLAVSLYFLRMPTLAAIVGQMHTDIKPHLNLVEYLLKNTAATIDSGPAYFPLIADIHLMERMAVIYEQPPLELPLYTQALCQPSRAINVNNSQEVLDRERLRRNERIVEILCKQFFGINIGRR